MVESWVVLGASGITAVAALGGSLIAIWVQGRREHQQWLRDRQAEVYAQVMRAHGQSLLDFGAMNAADPGTTAPDEIAKINAQAQLTIRQLMDGLTSLQVFGSNKVGELANDLGIKLSAHRNDLDNPKLARVGKLWRSRSDRISRSRIRPRDGRAMNRNRVRRRASRRPADLLFRGGR